MAGPQASGPQADGGGARTTRWNGVRVDVPGWLTDQSVLTFVDRPDAPALSVTMSQEALTGGAPALLRYVTDQIADIKASVPGYAVSRQVEAALPPFTALRLDAAVGTGARKRHQRQLYILDADGGRVIVLTVTCQEDRVADADSLIETLGKSIKVEAV